MTLPPYDDATLAAFMVRQLGAVGEALAWTVSTGQVTDAVDDVTSLLGVDIESVTDVQKIRTIGRWRIWSAALGSVANGVDLKAGTSQVWLSQKFGHIQAMLSDAEAAASVYPEVQAALAGSGGVAVVSSLSGVSDPYGWRRCPEFG